MLDDSQKPKLIHGEDVPLTKSSTLVLVGHGARDDSGVMTLANYQHQDVAKIVQSTNRLSDTIKATSVVACDVGSDKTFVETLLKELHRAGIKTELHLRSSLLQTLHTGEETLELSPDGDLC